MSTSVEVPNATAIQYTVRNGSGLSDTSKNGSDENAWFTKPARHLLGSDSGLALHYLIDVPESTCYRWLRGEGSIHINRFRQLVHGPQGETWHAVFMDGCDQSWWRELQAARDLLIKFKIEAR